MGTGDFSHFGFHGQCSTGAWKASIQPSVQCLEDDFVQAVFCVLCFVQAVF